MSDLESLICDAVKRGEFNHLSVAVTGAKGDKFKASFRPQQVSEGASATNADPVAAMVTAITEGMKRRRPRAKVEHTSADEMDFG